jgi:UDP-glucose 4-epimerase
MAYVSDLVDGTLKALDSPDAIGEVINVGSDEEHSILDAAHLIHDLAGMEKPLKLNFVPHSELFGAYREISRRVPDLSKAKALLGFHPKVTFQEGIRRTLEDWPYDSSFSGS